MKLKTAWAIAAMAMGALTPVVGRGAAEPEAAQPRLAVEQAVADRILSICDKVCAVTNAVEAADGTVTVDFVLKPEPGSDIRCRAALPRAEKWDGRMWGVGNSGYAGTIGNALAAFAASGTAAVTTDIGTWAYTDCGKRNRKVWPDCVRKDYDWRATHLMTVYGKKLVGAYYGRMPDKSYFYGGSCGGRQGIGEAIRFPEDYDGVIANVPGNNSVDKEADIFVLWKLTHDESGKALFTTNDMQVVSDAAVRYMAKRDDKPYAGKFLSNPFFSEADIDGFLALAAETSPKLGKSDLQARLRKLYRGTVHNGRRVSHGELPGAYLGKTMNWRGHVYFPQYLMRHGKEMKDATFEDLEAFAREYGPSYNTCSDNLEAFRRHGGKLLVTVGLEDQTDPSPAAITHFERVVRRNGGDLKATQEFYRLFALPGCAHGGWRGRAMTSGPGNAVALRKQLTDWREKGVAPERIEARSRGIKGGKLPVAAWPKRLVQKDGKWEERTFDRKAIREPDAFYLTCDIAPWKGISSTEKKERKMTK